MPALCNVDYASMELIHARLVRTTACVDGCRCDYTICGGKDPYWKGQMLTYVAEHDGMPKLPFIRKGEIPI